MSGNVMDDDDATAKFAARAIHKLQLVCQLVSNWETSATARLVASV